MKHAFIFSIFLFFLALHAQAHEELTGDQVHDANLQHDQDMGPTVNEKDVSSWEDAAPYILGLFLLLGVFAFAIGLFMHPGKGSH